MNEDNKEQTQEENDNLSLSSFVEGETDGDDQEQDHPVEGSEQESDEAENDASEEALEDEKTEQERQEELKKKQEEYYRKRQEEKEARQKAVIAEQPQPQNSNNDDGDEYEVLKQLVRQQKFQQKLNAAEKELIERENVFKEAFVDYDDKVNSAMELTKHRLINQGYSETEAAEALRREKILLADRAAYRGLDPVEAVYKEANDILSTFEKFAESRGYIKPETKKTKLQAAREMSKPNAMAGGTGALAIRRTVDDLGDEDIEDINNMPLSEFR